MELTCLCREGTMIRPVCYQCSLSPSSNVLDRSQILRVEACHSRIPLDDSQKIEYLAPFFSFSQATRLFCSLSCCPKIFLIVHALDQMTLRFCQILTWHSPSHKRAL